MPIKLGFSIGGSRYDFTFKFWWLTALFVLLFSCLGLWQVQRAAQKRLLVAAYAARPEQQAPAFSSLFNSQEDRRFYSLELKGHYDNQHSLLLDNRTHQGQAGYELYTPFIVQGSKAAILVDRGWISAGPDRRQLPQLAAIRGTRSLKGVLNTPPKYFTLGGMLESPEKSFPLRVQYIDLKELSKILAYPLPPYILWLDPKAPEGFVREWKVSYMGPEKHILYAVQWFAFAGCLLVIFLLLNIHRAKEK